MSDLIIPPAGSQAPVARASMLTPLPTRTKADRWRERAPKIGIAVGVVLALIVAYVVFDIHTRDVAKASGAQYLPPFPSNVAPCTESDHGDTGELQIGTDGVLLAEQLGGLFDPMSPAGVLGPDAASWHFVHGAARCWDSRGAQVQSALAEFKTPADARRFFDYASNGLTPGRPGVVGIDGIPHAFTMRGTASAEHPLPLSDDGDSPLTWSLAEKGSTVILVLVVQDDDEKTADDAQAAQLITKIYDSLP